MDTGTEPVHRSESSRDGPQGNGRMVLVVHHLPLEPRAGPLTHPELRSGPRHPHAELAHRAGGIAVDLHRATADEDIGIEVLVSRGVLGLGTLDGTGRCAERRTDRDVAPERTGRIEDS